MPSLDLAVNLKLLQRTVWVCLVLFCFLKEQVHNALVGTRDASWGQGALPGQVSCGLLFSGGSSRSAFRCPWKSDPGVCAVQGGTRGGQ